MLDGKIIRMHRRMAELRLRDVASALCRSQFFVHRVERNLATLDESEERIVRKILNIPVEEMEHHVE